MRARRHHLKIWSRVSLRTLHPLLPMLEGNHPFSLKDRVSSHEAAEMKFLVIYLQYQQAFGKEQPKIEEENNKMR